MKASEEQKARVRRAQALKDSPAEVSIYELDSMTRPQLRAFVLRSFHPDGYYELPVTRWKDWTQAKQEHFGNIHDFTTRLE